MSAAEMRALLKAIEKIDKKIEWRKERVAEGQAEIKKLDAERDELAERYRQLNIAKMEAEENES